MAKRKLKVLDSFAGAGGFSLGFELTGNYEVIGAIEYDQWAADTFQYNHKNAKVLVGDIQSYSDDDLLNAFPDKPDIILGGPPCQGYSICNRNAGDPKDPRNSLFTEFLRLGKVFNPKIMIMENVPNIMKAKTADKEFVIDIIKKELESLGYSTYVKTLSATDYGVPQIRKRVVVVASKTSLDNPYPKPTHSVGEQEPTLFNNNLKTCPTLWDAISDLPDIEAREGAEEMDYDKEALNDYQNYLRKGSDKVYNNKAMNHSKRMVERFASMSWGHSVSDVPDHLKPYKRNGNGEISTKVYDQNNRRLFPDKPCHTIAASFYANFVHPYKNRNFTPREGARVQSFPDWYVFQGKPTVVSHKLLAREGRTEEKHLCQYNQIGNAVPPLMAKAIAENLYNAIKTEDNILECTYTETI
ncbi:MAG: DNA cytosine methyltransferase [Flavobacteriales bacterium]|nr:DNA cytosine methyltransferase [Flavobacteriales bacterium]